MKNASSEKGGELQIVFDLKTKAALPLQAVNVSNVKATVDGKELKARGWTGDVEDGIHNVDPFSDDSIPAIPEWKRVLTADGDFGGLNAAACDFSADVEVTCGKAPKAVSVLFPLPESALSEDDVDRTVEPILMRLESMESPDHETARKSGRRGGDMPMKLTGYSISANKIMQGEGTPCDRNSVFLRAFVVSGKEYPDKIDKDKATNPIRGGEVLDG